MYSPLLGRGTWEDVIKGAEAYRESLKAHKKELRRMAREDKKRIRASVK